MFRRCRPAPPSTRALAALLGAGVLLLTGLAAPPARAATADRFTRVATWAPAYIPPGQSFDNLYASTRVVFDPVRRVMWVAVGSPGAVVAYDADTLQPRSQPLQLAAYASSLTLDPATGGMIVVQSVEPVSTGFNAGVVPQIAEYTLQGHTLATAWQADLSSLGSGVEVASLGLDSKAQAVYIASQPAGPAFGAVTLSRLHLGGATPGVQWSVTLPPSCPVVPSPAKLTGSNVAAEMGLPSDGHAVYLLCGAPKVDAVRPPLPSGIGEVPLGSDPATPPALGALRLFPISGNVFDSAGSVFDPRSGRFFVDETNGPAGSLAVFDTTADRYVGLVDGATNRFSGLGFDAVSGRLYMMSTNPDFGLLVSDARTTPPSQPTRYPKWFSYGLLPIPVDSATSRVLVAHVPIGGGEHVYFQVLRDTQPPLDLGRQSVDPDSNTSDVAEAPGVTGATYSASAQGYGAVLRQVGGSQGAEQDVQNVFQIEGDSTPELRAAYLDHLTLSTDEATASSIPADRDQNTTGAEQSSVCASTPQQGQGVTCPWPYTPAKCSSFDTAAAQSTSGPSGSATSTCSQLQRSATTHAEYTGGDLGSVAVGALSTTSTLLEDATAGARVTVTSEARDVTLLGGALRIGRVATTATAHAHGRRGTAGTGFTRTVEGVVLNGTSLCDGTCNLDVVASEVEAAFPGRVRISFPTPDSGYAVGSRGGYQALLRISDANHLDDVLLSAQPADRIEVPGMVVASMLDTSRPSRTLVMLAGVEAEARYGIYPLDQFTADQSAGLAPGVPAAAVLAGDGAVLPPAAAPTVPALAPTRPTAAAAAPITALPALLGWHGWQWALTHPGEVLRLAAMWLVFLVPVYLAARRWSLLRRHAVEVELA